VAVEIRQSAGLRLVSDETYGLMTEGEPLPPAACADPTAVSLSTMSDVRPRGQSHRVDHHPRRRSDASAARRP
jgi:hypothetical protein